MSFEIDGTTWTPQSASEHATAIIERANAILQENDVRDDSGNIVQLKASYGNALYLLALGDGNRLALNDEKLTQAINSFNLELCDDAQIENLLPIAAISRNMGSYSRLTLTVTASADGACTIPSGTKAPYGDVNFVVSETAVIEAGTSQEVETVCDTTGSVTVLTGEITAFETSIANLESVENLESSIPGANPETIPELRQRIIKGDTIPYSTDGLKNALESLTGVTYARVYFNYNVNSVITLAGNVTVNPRHAYIVIYGSNDEIANTYAKYMNAETQNGQDVGTVATVTVTATASADGVCTIPAGTQATYEGAVFETASEVTIAASGQEDIVMACTTVGVNEVPVGGITSFDSEITNLESVYNYAAGTPGTPNPQHSQEYMSASGQSITIYYDDATERNVYVKVTLKEGAANDAQVRNQIKRDLIASSSGWGIGEPVTSLLTSMPFQSVTYTEVAYTQVSDDGGVTWTNIVETGCNVVPRVSDATIEVDQIA